MGHGNGIEATLTQEKTPAVDLSNYYAHFSRDELINHCVAYSEAMHQLGNDAQKLILTVKTLQKKLSTRNPCCNTHSD